MRSFNRGLIAISRWKLRLPPSPTATAQARKVQHAPAATAARRTTSSRWGRHCRPRSRAAAQQLGTGKPSDPARRLWLGWRHCRTRVGRLFLHRRLVQRAEWAGEVGEVSDRTRCAERGGASPCSQIHRRGSSCWHRRPAGHWHSQLRSRRGRGRRRRQCRERRGGCVGVASLKERHVSKLVRAREPMIRCYVVRGARCTAQPIQSFRYRRAANAILGWRHGRPTRAHNVRAARPLAIV